MTITRFPLSSTLGVELRGLDVERLPPAHVESLRDAFSQKHLVLIRGHDFNEDQVVRLTTSLGDISYASPRLKGGPGISYVSNVHPQGRLPDGELLFHADHMFLDHPLKATALNAQAVTDKGGETLFVDAAAAYETLPDALKLRIAGLSGRHVYDYSANSANTPPNRDAIPAGASSHVHPVVTTHPETGKKILFVCRLFTVELIGLERRESDALLSQLFDHMDARPTDYELKWKVGDLLIWDNCVPQHARNNFSSTEKRSMFRVSIAGAEEAAKRRAALSH